MQRIAIFASGAGSNAEKIIEHFNLTSNTSAEVFEPSLSHSEKHDIKVALIVCNKPGAGVLNIAERNNIPTLIIDKEKFFRGNAYLDVLKEKSIGFIVLAGFLWKIPDALIKAYPNKIINIHPALLPKYGGKGMYGEKVHQAVIDNKEKESGITIHYVDEHYDNGDIILQATCPVLPADTADTLAHRVHELEHRFYPGVIEKCISTLPVDDK